MLLLCVHVINSPVKTKIGGKQGRGAHKTRTAEFSDLASKKWEAMIDRATTRTCSFPSNADCEINRHTTEVLVGYNIS